MFYLMALFEYGWRWWFVGLWQSLRGLDTPALWAGTRPTGVDDRTRLRGLDTRSLGAHSTDGEFDRREC